MPEGLSKEKYFFQFSYVEDPSEVGDIAEFLGNYEVAPGTHICFGINLDAKALDTETERARIEKLYEAAQKNPLLVPVIHFTGKGIDQAEYSQALERIRREMPYAEYVQLNDPPDISEKDLLRKAIGLGFKVDLPVTDKFFDTFIQDEELKDLVRSNDVFICLDNSKGSGIQEPVDSAVIKIRSLLENNIRRCALFGGLGPMRLGAYRALSRRLRHAYPRVVISTDAETKLKTEGRLDLKKVRVYLHELLLLSGARLKQASSQDAVHITPESIKDFKSSCDENFIVSSLLCEKGAEYLHGKNILDVGGGAGDILSAQRVAAGASVLHLDVMDFSGTSIPASHSRLKGSFFDPSVVSKINAEGRIDTIFMSHVTQYLDSDLSALKESLQTIDPKTVITVENTNDDILRDVLDFSKATYANCNGEEKIPDFPYGYSIKETFPFTATLRAGSHEDMAVHFLYLMDIEPTAETIPPMLEFVKAKNLPLSITLNQAVMVYQKV